MKTPYEILYPDLPFIKHNQDATLCSLKKGEVDEIYISSQKPIDDIIRFGLSNNFLKESLCSFPDPRKSFDIPIDILLLPQIIQRLDDEHSLVSAPYMLNSSELITRLGYNAKILETGFNNKNKHERETIFHGETLKHLLLSSKADHLIEWFNENWCKYLSDQAPGRTRTYLLDGTKLIIPNHLVDKYQNAGTVKNNDGTIESGYKIVWLRELIDQKRITRGMLIAPIHEHDFPLGKRLVDNFLFEKDATLIMDRGFLDAEWIKKLSEEREIQITIPLKKNSEITQFAVAQAEADNKWKPHPTRKDQEVYKLSESDLLWEKCPVFESGVLVRFQKKDGTMEHIVFVSTKKNFSPTELLNEYDLRFEIEEDHRQLKCFQGIETLPSKKYVNVVFRVIMGLVAYDLFNLFLNSEECDSLESYTLKLKRQKHCEVKNPEVIIYADETFAIINYYDFLDLLLSLPKKVQTILRKNFKKISSE